MTAGIHEEVTQDPALYRQMREPHESLPVANVAWLAFCEEVRTARAKFRIADVVVLAYGRALHDGKPELVGSSLTIGSSTRCLALVSNAAANFLKRDVNECLTNAIGEDAISDAGTK